MWEDILETYRVLISHRKNLPGARIEQAFPRGVSDLEKEHEFLKRQAAKDGTTIPTEG
jgi:hypothetical protein